ncbi:MAG: hypothetical protein FWD42_00980, partial [Solirubrobacterales bacterium]|nr:hypothetical protein [Solirubrobacterales bacterium]
MALERACDRDLGARGRRELPNSGVGIDLGAERAERAEGLTGELALAPPPDGAREPVHAELAGAHVLDHREGVQQPEVLVDHRQPEPAHRGGARRKRDPLAVDQQRAAGIGRVIPAEQLDQGRLAGAVLAHEPVDLAGCHAQRRP